MFVLATVSPLRAAPKVTSFLDGLYPVTDTGKGYRADWLSPLRCL